jgi:creatinine amidohydrolase
MAQEGARWGRYEQLRPDALELIVRLAPVAYWPLGLLEHHGWHLPVGFDGIKAHRLCERIAQRTGGVVLPVMWWGGLGGHADFRWTLYQPVEAPQAILAATLKGLIANGFRCIVLLAGHYPWRTMIANVLPGIQREHPEVLVIHGTEADIGAPDVRLPGDHAARWETTYGQVLLPELVDMAALKSGRSGASAWSESGPPRGNRHPGVNFDADDPLFAQAGEDARTADSAEGEAMLSALVDYIAGRVRSFLIGA